VTNDQGEGQASVGRPWRSREDGGREIGDGGKIPELGRLGGDARPIWAGDERV
jgi:hypothetical protein